MHTSHAYTQKIIQQFDEFTRDLLADAFPTKTNAQNADAGWILVENGKKKNNTANTNTNTRNEHLGPRTRPSMFQRPRAFDPVSVTNSITNEVDRISTRIYFLLFVVLDFELGVQDDAVVSTVVYCQISMIRMTAPSLFRSAHASVLNDEILSG